MQAKSLDPSEVKELDSHSCVVTWRIQPSGKGCGQLNPSDQPATRLAATAGYISAPPSLHRNYANITCSCTDMEGSTWLEWGFSDTRSTAATHVASIGIKMGKSSSIAEPERYVQS